MKPQFELIRFPEEKLTKGILLFNNEILCDTLEDVVRDINADGDLDDEDEGKVYGQTAIPYTIDNGYYELTVTYSNHFKKNMTLVNNVNDFKGIRIHWGRTIEQSLGCILVGKENGETLDNVGMTDKITSLVAEMQKTGKVYLQIK